VDQLKSMFRTFSAFLNVFVFFCDRLKCEFICRCAKLIGRDALSQCGGHENATVSVWGPTKCFLELRDVIQTWKVCKPLLY